MTSGVATLPPYLASLPDFTQHLEEEFENDDSIERGRRFVLLVQQLVPYTELGARFPSPSLNPKESHDGGYDLLSASTGQGEDLYIQSRYKVRSVDDVDQIISNFQRIQRTIEEAPTQLTIGGDNQPQHTNIYMVVTSTKLDNLFKKYRQSRRSSVPFCEQLLAEKRLALIDGRAVLEMIQALYTRNFTLPDKIALPSPQGWLSTGNVYMGFVEGALIGDLYVRYGEGLFFENIRDFLGQSDPDRRRENRESVNASITQTIQARPDEMLAKNNGVTFRATEVQLTNKTAMLVSGAAIVNGCQTTMCLYHSRPVPQGCLVPVKVVVTPDAWEVARAANYQNPVRQVDLDLARYLRPQLVDRVAAELGYTVGTPAEGNVLAVLKHIHGKRADYDEIKALYIGLFSRRPNNVWEDHYADIRSDVLHELFDKHLMPEEDLFRILFNILGASRRALERCEKAFASEEVYKRFHQRAKYRAYLTLLALASIVPSHLALTKRDPEPAAEAAKMREFLHESDGLVADKRHFLVAYLNSFQVLAGVARGAAKSDQLMTTVVLNEMYTRVSSAQFESMVEDIHMRNESAEVVAHL